jgi:group II intron reverse transcriptase/maturase
MNDSQNQESQQKTSYEGSLVEVRLEAVGKQGALRDSVASETTKAETSQLMERIIERENFRRAYKRVKANKGAPGIDGMTVEGLGMYLKENIGSLRESLLNGSYRPLPVRRVEIPKPDGGIRLLGIPTVIDRFVQQSISQVLSEIYEPTFSEGSYGFRPGRSAHGAIEQARQFVDAGKKWVVDMDLEKFFDTVHHDRLMYRLSTKIEDKRLLRLIRRYLQAGILLNGVKVSSTEGTPQGGSLSPLLSNIVLDELDRELENRGHSFVRYADDGAPRRRFQVA